MAQLKIQGIETPRLMLKALDTKDIPSIYNLLDEGESPFFPSNSGNEDSKQKIVNEMTLPGGYKNVHGEGVRFAIYDKQTQEAVGTLTIAYDRHDNVFRIPYAVAEAHQNKGIATEAMDYLLITYKVLSKKDIPLMVFPLSSNLASRKVFEKLGFKYLHDLEPIMSRGQEVVPQQSVYQFVE